VERLLLNAVTFRVSVESLGLGKLAALVVAPGVTFVFGFWLNRRWTFGSRYAT
jgi:putative flippase GtrA